MGKNKESINNHPEPSRQILPNPKYHPKSPKYHTAKIPKISSHKDPPEDAPFLLLPTVSIERDGREYRGEGREGEQS